METKNLIPGDCLLYGRTPFLKSPIGWFFGLVINIKTWSRFSHVEIYAGNKTSMASRDGVGVGFYPLRKDQLLKVRRPSDKDFDYPKGVKFSLLSDGQKYDWLGLLCFTYAVHSGSKDKQFCSEFATRFYRKAGLEPFNPEVDADHVAPAQFDQSPALRTVWKKP